MTHSAHVAALTATRVALALIIAGAVERLFWLFTTARHDVAGGEAANVAAAFARSGSIADVFGKGSGLTAHLNPVLPAFAGTIYRLFGTHSVVSERLLSITSIACVLAAAWLMYCASGHVGLSQRARLTALGVFCLLPLNNYLEIVDFRVWEGGLATLLSAAALFVTIRADVAGVAPWRTTILVAVLAGVAFFVSPPIGLVAYANAVLLLIRRVPVRRWAATAGMALVALAAVLTPWTLRNYAAFGRFIPTRGNFGLELAIGNHPAAVSPDDELGVLRRRLDQVHPQMSWTAFHAMQRAGGELGYADQLGAEAKGWIRAHPGEFGRLMLRHLRQFYFPPAWQWEIYGSGGRGQPIKLAVTWLISALGLLGAGVAAIVWRGRYAYIVTAALLPALPYVIAQPVPRYRYLVFLPLLMLAAELVSRSWPMLRARIASARHPRNQVA